jgi:hypothetical protein
VTEWAIKTKTELPAWIMNVDAVLNKVGHRKSAMTMLSRT